MIKFIGSDLERIEKKDFGRGHKHLSKYIYIGRGHRYLGSNTSCLGWKGRHFTMTKEGREVINFWVAWLSMRTNISGWGVIKKQDQG